MAANELGNYHNRLTHSLKVAQLGRAIASRLDPEGPDPDLVEAACLAHDIGHPPFGHAGEEALAYALYTLRCREKNQKPYDREVDDPAVVDGFEGNAQNLRVLSYLSIHADGAGRGLHLTRGTLAACTKYPWTRGDSGKKRRKWGAYESEREVLKWVMADRPSSEAQRPVEAQLMDWCDDVTYACHDMEDFYRQGLIPLDRLFDFDVAAEHNAAAHDENPELSRFLDFVKIQWNEKMDSTFDRQAAVIQLHRLSDRISVVEPYRPTSMIKAQLKQTITDLIGYFADDVEVTGDPPIWYSGRLTIPEDRAFTCWILKQLIWFYVIDQPAFAAQQRGQQRIIHNLVTWYADEPERLLPEDRREELEQHQDVPRAIADHVATLSESHAVALHRRLSGHNLGNVTDAV